jgi:hypothetical protein
MPETTRGGESAREPGARDTPRKRTKNKEAKEKMYSKFDLRAFHGVTVNNREINLCTTRNKTYCDLSVVVGIVIVVTIAVDTVQSKRRKQSFERPNSSHSFFSHFTF